MRAGVEHIALYDWQWFEWQCLLMTLTIISSNNFLAGSLGANRFRISHCFSLFAANVNAIGADGKVCTFHSPSSSLLHEVIPQYPLRGALGWVWLL